MYFKKALLLLLIFIFIGCSSESKSLSITPSSVKFNDVNIGDSREIEVVLKNKYGKDLIISTFSLSGSNDFSITAGGSVPLNFLKNTSHTLKVRFEPTSTGVLAGLISILHDASNNPVEVELSGNGIPVARAVFSENNHDFQKTLNGTTRDYDFEVDNIGTADLIISNFTFTGVGASVYSISAGGNVPVTIIPGITHTFTVSFAPTADGQYPSILQISHNAVNENSPFEITLEAEGVTAAAEITLNQSSPWDVGEIVISLSPVFDLEISNTGIHDLTVSDISLTTDVEFKITGIENSNGNAITKPCVVDVGDKIIAKIEFTPIDMITYNDTIVIIHDGINVGTPINLALVGKGRALLTESFTNPGNSNWTVPAGVTSVKVLVVGAGGGGSGSHYGGGGSGWSVVRNVNVTPGSNIAITVGAGGAGGIIGTNSSPGGHGTDSKFGTSVTATGGKGGGGGGAGYYTGGDGGSGGGGAGNMGYAGKGGSAGSNGDPGATYAGGIGGHFDSLTSFITSLTAGAGGAAGTSTNAGGGGAGGVLLNGNGPNGGDGGESWSGKGGKGYGAGGGSGGYNSGTRPGGGIGADGFIFIEY